MSVSEVRSILVDVSADTPLNSIKRDWCPRARKYCFCQDACLARTPDEVARAERTEVYPRAKVGLDSYHASIRFATDLNGRPELAKA